MWLNDGFNDGVHLLHIDLQKFDRYISVCKDAITNSYFQVVSGGLGEGLAEPWRVVECAAGAGGTTTSTIPQWVIRERIIVRKGV